MDLQYAKAMRESLIWLPQYGYGYFPVTAGNEPYDQGYWDEYVRRGNTDIGRQLNKFRVRLVDRWTTGNVVDIGIGAGTFIEERNDSFYNIAGGLTVGPDIRTYGYDVNPRGVQWLKERELWVDWEAAEKIESVTMWDVLEHLHEPHKLLAKVERFVFVSIPIFEGPEHILRSRHYKPKEHVNFWSRWGFHKWANGYDFDVVEETWQESVIGRDSVGTFVLRRRD